MSWVDDASVSVGGTASGNVAASGDGSVNGAVFDNDGAGSGNGSTSGKASVLNADSNSAATREIFLDWRKRIQRLIQRFNFGSQFGDELLFDFWLVDNSRFDNELIDSGGFDYRLFGSSGFANRLINSVGGNDRLIN